MIGLNHPVELGDVAIVKRVGGGAGSLFGFMTCKLGLFEAKQPYRAAHLFCASLIFLF